MPVATVDVDALHRARAAGAAVLDVREDAEIAICHLPGAHHVPLGALVDHLATLATLPAPIYCLCHHGIRSAHAASILRDHGIEAINVHGGIDAWAHRIDPAMPRY